MLQLIQARYDKGIVPIIDVDQATIQYTIAAGAVPQYERQIVQLENTLSILIGQNPGPVQTGKPLSEQNYEIDLPLARPVDLLSRRPDVIASEYDLIAQNARVGAAKGNRFSSASGETNQVLAPAVAFWSGSSSNWLTSANFSFASAWAC